MVHHQTFDVLLGIHATMYKLDSSLYYSFLEAEDGSSEEERRAETAIMPADGSADDTKHSNRIYLIPG